MNRLAWVVGVSWMLVGCGGGDDAAAGGDPTSANGDAASGSPGSNSSGGPGSNSSGGPGSTTDSGSPKDGATVDGAQSPSGGGDPVGTCDPGCTGTKMCDDAQGCVCAPGFVAAGADCVPAAITNPATRTKAEVCARYAADTAAPGVLFKPGSAGGTCDPGSVPYAGEVAALRYLNFYRWMIGVGPVQVVPAMAPAEQQCARILNFAFGHSPDPSTQCYTAAGAQACGASLIASGYDVIHQFDGYALETEQNLIHRRNVLAVGRAGVWAGGTGNSSAMHYGGAYPALASDPAIVAHPGPGFNVRSKVPPRWFVQKGTASIAAVDARVFVAATNEQKPMKRYHHYTDFSSFDLDAWSPVVNTKYRVELVDDASKVVSTFETTFVDCP